MQKTEQIAAHSLATQAYTRLKADIFDFRFLPGDRFSETEVSERLRMSRTPIREALFRLQREGYVEVSPRNGWQVRPFDFEMFEQLYDVRAVLETAAVEQLCGAGDTACLRGLAQIWFVPAELRIVDAPTLSFHDERFHEQLVEATGNKEMARIHHDITERIRVIRRLEFTKEARIDVSYDEHGSILRAIIERRAPLARDLLHAHIRVSRDEVKTITVQMLQQARARARAFSIG